MTHVVRSIQRPSRAVLEAVARYSPATLHEAQGRRGALDSMIKPIYPGIRVCGPALTARCTAGDNLMLQVAISVAQPGDVLVIDAGDNHQQGGFGEVLMTACRARGIAGLITNASVRDGQALRENGFPAFARGLCMKGTVKESLGDVNRPVVIGGEYIRPGDIVAGDDDGVVVVRAEEAKQVAESSREREEKEARFMAALREGADVLEVLGMDRVLEAKGCRWGE